MFKNNDSKNTIEIHEIVHKNELKYIKKNKTKKKLFSTTKINIITKRKSKYIENGFI